MHGADQVEHLAAFASLIAGERYLVRELKWAFTRDPSCVFEVEKEK